MLRKLVFTFYAFWIERTVLHHFTHPSVFKQGWIVSRLRPAFVPFGLLGAPGQDRQLFWTLLSELGRFIKTGSISSFRLSIFSVSLDPACAWQCARHGPWKGDNKRGYTYGRFV